MQCLTVLVQQDAMLDRKFSPAGCDLHITAGVQPAHRLAEVGNGRGDTERQGDSRRDPGI